MSTGKSEDDDGRGGDEDPPTNISRRPDSIQEMARCSQSSYHLMVMLGDITNLKVDVLVNPSNKELKHTGGLAKAIADKGGKSLQQDCDEHIKKHKLVMEGAVYLGKAGNLNCNFIAHAVVPVWQEGEDNEEKLRKVVLKSMEEANNKQQTSIALPALGTGACGYPANNSTRPIVKAVDDFHEKNPGCCLKHVYVCDINQKHVDSFTKDLQNHFGTRNVSLSGHVGGVRDKWSTPHAIPQKEWQKPTQDVPPSYSTSPAKYISIKLVKGQIAKQEVDIIVNTCSKDLKLSTGAVSSSILSAAGNQLQAECDQKYHGITFGDIAITKGYNLKCQNVFHGALPSWDHGASVLQKFMLACLQEATNRGYQSIAFPAMGTGNLGYPRNIVAKDMFQIVTNYSIQTPSSSLKEVLFVIYDRDIITFKAFEKAEQNQYMTYDRPPKGVNFADMFKNWKL